MAVYTTSLRLVQPATGEYSGTWGTQVNNGITALVDTSVAGTATITMTAANYTLSTANGATDEARAAILSLGGTPGGSYNVIVPAVSKLYVVVNATGSAQTVKTAAGTGISVPNGATAYLRCNGTDVVAALNYFGSLTLGAALPVSSGGTGATTLTGVVKGTGTSALTAGTVSLTTEVSGTLPTANGGTGSTSTTYCSLTTNVTGTLPVGNGGTGGTTFTVNNVLLGNGTSSFQVVAPGSSGNLLTSNGTTWQSTAPSFPVLSANNAFTGANTFYNATGQTFGTATSTQDGIIITGRAGGSTSLRVTLSPGTLTASRAVTFPDAAGAVVLDTATQTVTNKTFGSSTTFLASTTTTQDGIAVTGRAGGSSSFRATIQPTTLTASRTVTLPNETFTVGFRNIPAVGTQTGSYSLTTSDVGKYVQVGTGGSITIPDATFAEGDVVMIFNNTSGNITITCTITTAYIGGTDADKATVTVATRGVANIMFISGTVCVITGNVS